MTRGFLLGKFMPVHQGHLFLCDVAATLVDELTVLVCTRDCEPIDGTLRLGWVRDSVRANVRLRHLDRDVPQEPADHPDFWRIWADIVREFHPEPIDTVFGSEDYVVRLAQVAGAAPFIVDLGREALPVSATAIRDDPRGNWGYVPPVVRPYFQKRVCLLGPESTGKSTGATMLAQVHDTLSIPEYGRTYDAVIRIGEGWTEADFVAIARGHAGIRQEVCKRAGWIVFEDTDLIQTLVWAEYLLGAPLSCEADLLAGFVPADLYLLLSPDVAWIDDGTRYAPDAATRSWFFEQCHALLTREGLPFEVVTGSSYDDRLRAMQGIVSSA